MKIFLFDFLNFQTKINFEKKIPSKIKIPLKYFFNIETLKNHNFLKIYIIQFHELFYTFYTFKKIFFAFFKKS